MTNPNSDCDRNINPISARNHGIKISSRRTENHYCSPTLTKKLQKLVLAELEFEDDEEEASSNDLTASPVRENAVAGDCTTPTAKEHRIPDAIMTCPPAPRKRKALLPEKDRWPNKLTVAKSKFFASPPELETAFRINFSGN